MGLAGRARKGKHVNVGPRSAAAAAPELVCAERTGKPGFWTGLTLLQRSSAKGRYVSDLLWSAYTHHRDADPTDVGDDDLVRYVRQLSHRDLRVRLRAANMLRKMVSTEQCGPTLSRVVQAGAVQPLLKIITQEPDEPKLVFEAVWVVLNLCGGSTQEVTAVLDAGGLPVLIHAAREYDPEICEQAVWTIGNIAGDSVPARDKCLASGTVDLLLHLIAQHKKSAPQAGLLSNCVWTLSNLCRGKPGPDIREVGAAVPVLCELLRSCDGQSVHEDALWALSYVSDGSQGNIQVVLDAGALPELVSRLTARKGLAQPALRTIGNIATGTDTQTEQLLHAGALAGLKGVLDSPSASNNMVKEACWVVSNITAGTRDQIGAVLEQGLLSSCVDVLHGSHPHNVRKEATWCLANALSGADDSQLEAIGDQKGHLGCYTALMDPQQQQLHGEVISGFSRVLSAGGQKVYLRHGGVELTDPNALLADTGICAESVVEFVAAADEEPRLEHTGPGALPVFVLSMDGRKVPLDVPGDGTVGALSAIARTRFEELGWSTECPVGLRNRFVNDLLEKDTEAAEKLVERAEEILTSDGTDVHAGEVLRCLLRDYFDIELEEE